MLSNRRVFAVLALAGFAVAPLHAADEGLTGSALAELKGTPPAAPSEFKTTTEVRDALVSGKVKLMPLVRPVPDDVEMIEGIEYGKGDKTSLQLDLYRPKNLSKPTPVLVFIHGGSWSGGKRTDYRPYGIDFAKRGYIVASITYRLVKEAIFPAAVEDSKCAVRFLRANAKQYHVDPDRIAVVGGSAGGHLAMMIGYSSDVPELEGNGGNSGVSSRVQAVVDLYGPTDLTTQTASTDKRVIRFIGGDIKDAAAKYKLASPITHVTKDDPPTLIIHGTIDDTVQVDQSDMLVEKLKEAGVPYVFDRLPGWPHAMDLAQPVNDRCEWLIEHFLARYLPLPK